MAGLAGTRIRVVVSCASATWNRLDRQSPLRLARTRYQRGLAASALHLLAESGSAAEFITGYAQATIGMARETGFVLTEWTRPEAPDAGS